MSLIDFALVKQDRKLLDELALQPLTDRRADEAGARPARRHGHVSIESPLDAGQFRTAPQPDREGGRADAA